MKKFSELNIKTQNNSFEGDKIDIFNILNRVIVIHKYKIESSKFQGKSNPLCLHMQITINDVKHVVFSGSKILQELIQQVSQSDFPIETTIIKENRRFMFT